VNAWARRCSSSRHLGHRRKTAGTDLVSGLEQDGARAAIETGRKPLAALRLGCAFLLAVWGLSTVAPAQVQAEAPKKKPAAIRTAHLPELAEAWYVATPVTTPDTCGLPTGCLPVDTSLCSTFVGCLPVAFPALTEQIYPVGTLHLGVAAGQTSGQAFVVPDFTSLPYDAHVLRGTMSLPLSEAPEAGNASPDTAKAVACAVTSEVTDAVYGSLDPAPTYDCAKASAPLVFDAERHRFTIDLAPFLPLVRDHSFKGLALTPAPDAAPTDAWQVSINGYKASEQTHLSTVVAYRVPVLQTSATDHHQPPPPLPPITGTQSLPELPPVIPPVATTVVPPAPVPTAADPLEPAPIALMNAPWYSYPGVVFLPLAFLGALALSGISLTRPLGSKR